MGRIFPSPPCANRAVAQLSGRQRVVFTLFLSRVKLRREAASGMRFPLSLQDEGVIELLGFVSQVDGG